MTQENDHETGLNSGDAKRRLLLPRSAQERSSRAGLDVGRSCANGSGKRASDAPVSGDHEGTAMTRHRHIPGHQGRFIFRRASRGSRWTADGNLYRPAGRQMGPIPAVSR
jgi:hypothetical protein